MLKQLKLVKAAWQEKDWKLESFKFIKSSKNKKSFKFIKSFKIKKAWKSENALNKLLSSDKLQIPSKLTNKPPEKKALRSEQSKVLNEISI